MTSVVLDHVTVEFPVYGHHSSFRSALMAKAGGLVRREKQRGHRVTIRSVDDVSLALSQGDRVALVGHNGAGKSTLLRVMAGVYEPVRGSIRTEGRIAPLFNASPGLDPEDTGRENIITCCLFLGMTHGEIERRMPEIEAFTELGDYLSLPVRTYSTGMLTRLGFAISTAVEPDILLLDEGVGAGDARFAERATERIRQLVSHSSILVLASHAEELIQSMCTSAILMDHGKLLMHDTVERVLDRYRSLSAAAA